MAGISSSQQIGATRERSGARRAGEAVVRAPRLLMSWEDWLTFGAVMLVFLTVAASIQSANWVNRMPPMVPTAATGLLVGLFAARIRANSALIHPVALAIGVLVVLIAAQSYADGDVLQDRLADVRVRMTEWWNIVRAGDISNDNLPFVILVHGITFLAAYLGTWSVYRWHNPWLAVIPGGVVILANISALRGEPSVGFIFYLFGAMLLIARLHLQKRQAEWKQTGVDYPDFLSLSAANFAVWIVTGLMVFAWLVPLGTQAAAVESAFDKVGKPIEDRADVFVRLFSNLNAGRGGNFHDFGTALPVRGDVQLGSKALYEVDIPEAALLRAAGYSEYTGVGWLAGEFESERVEGGEIRIEEEAVYRDRRVTSITLTVLDDESTVLFAGSPLGTNLDSIFRIPGGSSAGPNQVISRRGLDKGDTYNAVGSISTASPDSLRAAGTDYPGWITDYYLQLPESLPDRVRQFAADAAAGAQNPYDIAVALESLLRTFPYDLTVTAAPPGTDTVEHFLFTEQRGYFDFHASAMAVLLRTQGVPAQIVVGYAVDPEDLNPDGSYTVRKDDAYAWVEAFFPGYGWIVFNPTPDRPAGDANEGAGGSILDGFTPSDLGPEPSLEEIFDELGGFGDLPSDVSGPLTESPVVAPDPFPWWIVWTIAAVMAAIAALAMSGSLAYTWGTRGMPVHQRHWARIQRVGRWAGLSPGPEETAREWSARVGSTVDRPGEASTLARAYEAERYGRRETRTPGEDETNAYRALRNRLFKRVVRRRERVENDENDLFA